MRRTFALKASANSAGYCVALKINGREFVRMRWLETLYTMYMVVLQRNCKTCMENSTKSTGNTKIFYTRKIKCLRLSVRCTDL